MSLRPEDAKLFIKECLKRFSHRIHKWNEIDHVCYRASSSSEYDLLKKEALQVGSLLAEADVQGRPIAIFKFHDPLWVDCYRVDYLELPHPKPSQVIASGWEHIEVVTDTELETSIGRVGVRDLVNYEVSETIDNFRVKFHCRPIDQVIRIESNKRIMQFLGHLIKFPALFEFSPLISGTLPLSISTPNSDLDILFQVKDLDIFESHLSSYFSNQEGFQKYRTTYQGYKSSVTNFTFDDLKVELFAQDKSVFLQNAHQHLLVEGRLLRLLGYEFSIKVLNLKLQGIKTEMAFGEILGLGEPYLELIEIGRMSDKELLERFASLGR